MTVDVGELLGVLAQAVIVLGGLYAGYLWLRKWVQRAAQDSQHALKQLETSNGKTAGQLIEETATKVTGLTTKAEANRELANEAQALARSALAVAQNVDSRLDAHLSGHER